MQFSKLFLHFKKMKGFFIFAGVLFLAGGFLGYYSEAFHEFLDQQLNAIRDIARELNEGDNVQLSMFLFIFINNAVKCVIIIFLGLLLGVVPFIFVVINGMVLGYLVFTIQTTLGTGEVISMIVKGILPHGIIEIPVFLIAAAYGMKIGMTSIGEVIRAIQNKRKEGDRLVQLLKLSLPLSVVIVFSLLIAALIESIITPIIMNL